MEKEENEESSAESRQEIGENLLNILLKTKKAIKREDTIELFDLSNRTIHSASIHQDSDNIAIAVLVYSIAKILSRQKYESYKEWPKFYSEVMSNLDNLIQNLKINNMQGFRDNLAAIQKSIDKLSGHLRDYIKDVFFRASINKASRIYEHGISMSQTAYALGIMPWELAEYAGRTGIGDIDLSITMPIKERLKKTFEVLE